MTAPSLAPTHDGLATFGDFRRTACWDPVAECTMTMARPSAEPDLFARYHRGAVASYARFGVSDALDPDVDRCAEDTALFWVLTDISGQVVGGVRAKGPLRGPEDSHAVVEWAGHPGEDQVHAAISERVPLGILEMKAAWLDKEPGGGRRRAKMIARSGFHAMGLFDITYCMATSAAHILDQWRSSGGVVADIPAAPYPNEHYQTQMMWWDRRTFAAHGDPVQVSAIIGEIAQTRRGVVTDRTAAAPVWRGALSHA
ncbi:hypothetical protein [Mycolicibacterium sp. YH-1]|uniref:hypothetical protein n=1 Tax=Mycolicibacterium sp. YH-1 TaxID=2908837 RepID=UPI001F4C004B|nr:hypothetical protein [Mycolicibacterium sp. YH-1]UNB51980.1 hypothetical protein L0M16_29570 [Mycolicibacterium sp. YH-1]